LPKGKDLLFVGTATHLSIRHNSFAACHPEPQAKDLCICPASALVILTLSLPKGKDLLFVGTATHLPTSPPQSAACDGAGETRVRAE
jgi:hypothetical protein